jgi:photoprotection regulator FRP-like protein
MSLRRSPQYDHLVCEPRELSSPKRIDLVEVRKTVARTAFDAALGRELHEVIHKTKQMANVIQQSADLWDLEHYLTQRRKEIDRKYEYRYSRLTQVFGRLLNEKRISEQELRGLREDKMKPIRSFAKFLAETDAVA